MFSKRNKCFPFIILGAFLFSGCNIVPVKASSTYKDDIIYPQDIELIDFNNITEVKEDVGNAEEKFDYYFVYWSYKEGDTFTIKAVVKPDNSFYQDVIFVKDQQNTDFSIVTNDTDTSLDNGCARFILNTTPDPVVSCRFFVKSTNPGIPITIKAAVVFTTIPST